MLWRGCLLRVGVIGMNFKTAQIGLLEQISRAAQYLSGERGLFFKHPTIILSTCNRTEIYFSALDLAEAQGDILCFLRSHIEGSFEHKLYSYFGIDAFSHLCRVTAGLDSAILAETEIQRQVKLAYAKSKGTLILPECLHYVFQKALKIGKQVRSEAFLEKGSVTLYGTLWQRSIEILGDLKKRSILLIGYSEINRGFASFLLHRGVHDFFLCTTKPADVSLEGAIVCGREVLNHWKNYDLIVCASKSAEYLIAGEGKGGLIFDLSVPRNVDPAVQGVQLMNIEQIHQLIERKQQSQGIRLAESETFIEKSVFHLARLYRAKIERKKCLDHQYIKIPHVQQI